MTTQARRACGRLSGGTNPFPGVLVSVLVLASVLASCSSPMASPATRQVRISPVTSTGARAGGFRVATTATSAMCEPGSEAIGDGYRCFAGNTIYDPCWAETAPVPTVLCLPYPWSRSAVSLRLRQQLGTIPGQGGPGLAEPWGLELAGGQRCLLAQGAHTEFAGQVIDYYCTAKLWLLRGLTERGPVWRASSVIISKAGKQSRGPVEEIRIAWFGRPDTFR